MKFQDYVRTPFAIKAIEVTDENFEEVAAFCGKSIETTNNGDRYIFVNRRIIPTGSKIFTGWWITLMEDNVRCYPPRSFHSQFVPLNGKIEFVLESSSEETAVPSTAVTDQALVSLEEVIDANRNLMGVLTTNSPLDLEVDED